VGNAVVDLLLVRIRLGVALRDALRNNTRVALRVTCVLTILTLHTRRILEKFSAESTAHDVVELVLHKLVAVHFVDFFLALPYGALSSESKIYRSSVFVLLDEAEVKLDPPGRL